MDRVLRHAIGAGLDPMTAIQMCTINTAEHFGLTREMGMIAPGRWADVVLVKELHDFQADLVVAKGQDDRRKRSMDGGFACRGIP